MNIANIHDCYGCGVCAAACPRRIISMRLNGDGFYEPHIADESRCTGCALCLDVCSYSHDGLALEAGSIKSYAAWSNDVAVRRKCSSGGVGFEVGRMLISQGYKVCGVRYDAGAARAEHYVASTVEELVQSAGSKYIQSYTVNGFRAIDRKGRWLVTGTPCQIDSFRRYIRRMRCEDRFVLMDFSAMVCRRCSSGGSISQRWSGRQERPPTWPGATSRRDGTTHGRCRWTAGRLASR